MGRHAPARHSELCEHWVPERHSTQRLEVGSHSSPNAVQSLSLRQVLGAPLAPPVWPSSPNRLASLLEQAATTTERATNDEAERAISKLCQRGR